ncbi:reverse transcriptase [Lasius niger]|uniref:Reverse transcriptase n=1 Tax=Lasius niger TaxID=67767 RepID=A0A0J7KMT3_LASNI|nr:reverse transcriptase [Lasius niger]
MIDNYLSNRCIEYTIDGGKVETKSVTSGVPQGSILGPLLWNIGYVYVPETGLEQGCRILCYADDTLILVTSDNTRDIVNKANLQTDLVINRIRRLGLRVSAPKTEMIIFYGRKSEREIVIRVDGEPIVARDSLKYFGIMLDSRMTFKTHFKYVEDKTTKIVRALGKLMPNIRGPGEKKRRLFANAVMSVLTYGAPVWYDELISSKRIQVPLNRMIRIGFESDLSVQNGFIRSGDAFGKSAAPLPDGILKEASILKTKGLEEKRRLVRGGKEGNKD